MHVSITQDIRPVTGPSTTVHHAAHTLLLWLPERHVGIIYIDPFKHCKYIFTSISYMYHVSALHA